MGGKQLNVIITKEIQAINLLIMESTDVILFSWTCTSPPQVSKSFTAACHKAGPSGVHMSDRKIESRTSVKKEQYNPPKFRMMPPLNFPLSAR